MYAARFPYEPTSARDKASANRSSVFSQSCIRKVECVQVSMYNYDGMEASSDASLRRPPMYDPKSDFSLPTFKRASAARFCSHMESFGTLLYCLETRKETGSAVAAATDRSALAIQEKANCSDLKIGSSMHASFRGSEVNRCR